MQQGQRGGGRGGGRGDGGRGGGGGGHRGGGGGYRGSRGGGGGRPQDPRGEGRQFTSPTSPRSSGSSSQQEASPRFFPSPPKKQMKQEKPVEIPSGQEHHCPSPQPPATQVQKRPGLCSIYTIKVQPGRKAYRYDVDIWRMPMPKANGELDRGKSLVRAADDGQRAMNRDICFELLTIAFNKTNRFGMTNGNELVYDCKAVMFTSMPLNKIDQEGGQEIIIENQDVNKYVQTYCGEGLNVRFSVKIERNKEVPELDLNDFRQYQSGRSVFEENRSLRTFFEMATTQLALNNEVFSMIGPGRLYEFPGKENTKDVGNGMHLRNGLVKGVKVIKNGGGNGANGGPRAAVVLDTRVSAFFVRQKLVFTVLEMLPPARNNQPPQMRDFSPDQWREVEKLLRDLRVEVNYRRIRTFELGKFTDKPVKDLYLDMDLPDGGTKHVSIPEFFLLRYQIKLQFPGLPGIRPNTPLKPGQKTEIFPLEVLTIMDDQRVPIEKTSPDLMSSLLNANSLLPAKRMEMIMRRARELELFHDKNPVLQAFGISIDQKSNRCEIGIRPLPRLRFGNRTINANSEKAEWRQEGSRLPYLETRQLNNWIVLCKDRDIGLAEEFAKRLMDMARNKGLRMGDPELVPFSCSENNDPDWNNKFESLAGQKIQYVMLIDQKRLATHGLLKLYEVMHKPVITQHVTFEKARDVVQKNQRQTLENIVNKMNMKFFGLNYEPLIEPCGRRFALETGEVLVIGYDVSHPAPMSGVDKRRLAAMGQTELRSLEPSVVGICANMAPNPHAFVGDYFYQESRREALELPQLRDRMIWILRNLEKNRPKHARPPYIFICRDGLSEGQFAMAAKLELEAIRIGCKEHDPNYKPKFVLVVGTKRHFKKFFTDDGFANNSLQVNNLMPGSVVDTKVVRADVTEFYLQPHFPLKGTGKQVEYSVLEKEVNMSMDELHALLMSLCYSHQIVNIATSLPEPVYQADELAKRGKNNFAALKKFYPDHVPEQQVTSTDGKSHVKKVDCHALNEMLCYWGDGYTTIAHRFTA